MAGLAEESRKASQAINDLATVVATKETEGTKKESSSKKAAKPPDEYDGNLENGQSFIRQLVLYLHGEGFSDMKAITIGLSYCSQGSAAEWRDQCVEQIEAHETAEAHNKALPEIAATDDEQPVEDPGPPFSSFPNFLEEFRARFCDPDPSATARTKMEYIAMNNNTAEQFVQDFKKYQRLSGHNDVMLMEMFEKGLHPRLAQRITDLENPPKTLKKWQDKAIQFDCQWRNGQARRKEARVHHQAHHPAAPRSSTAPTTPRVNLPAPKAQWRPPQPRQQWMNQPPRYTGNAGYIPRNQPPPRPTAPPPRDPNAMDIDRARAQGLCFKCGKRGHISRDCPDNR